jgi:hypothetical protein
VLSVAQAAGNTRLPKLLSLSSASSSQHKHVLTPVGLQDVHADALAAKTGTDM